MSWPIVYPMPPNFSCYSRTYSKEAVLMEWLHNSSAALFGRMTQVNIASVLNRLIHIEKLSFFR